jgi:predicted kinase
MNKKIIFLKGLPASGKSTWAKEFVDNNPNWLRVNKDDLRLMMHNGKWSNGNEKQVLVVRDAAIRSALDQGYNVIVDDTNFAPRHNDIKKIAAEHKAEVEEKYFDVPLEECLIRNQNRLNKVPDEVIKSMYNKYIKQN